MGPKLSDLGLSWHLLLSLDLNLSECRAGAVLEPHGAPAAPGPQRSLAGAGAVVGVGATQPSPGGSV